MNITIENMAFISRNVLVNLSGLTGEASYGNVGIAVELRTKKKIPLGEILIELAENNFKIKSMTGCFLMDGFAPVIRGLEESLRLANETNNRK